MAEHRDQTVQQTVRDHVTWPGIVVGFVAKRWRRDVYSNWEANLHLDEFSRHNTKKLEHAAHSVQEVKIGL